jgi:predicted kinase
MLQAYMRKWMRDRLKRRKKTPDEAAGTPKTAPLQPAYFEQEKPGAAGSPEAEGNKILEDSGRSSVDMETRPGQADAGPEPLPSSGESSSSSDTPVRRRRRRGRGGRGRTAQPSTRQQEALPPQQQAPVSREAGAPAPPAQPRTSKGVVVLAIGLPGSGKSSWFKRNNITPLSSDMLRALLFDDPTEQRFQDLIFSNLRSMLKARLIARRPMNYVDATNLTPHDRHSWIKLAKDFGYEVQAVFFDVPLEVCLERNQKRQRVVEEDVMRRFAGKLKPPTFEEGFSKITVVRVKQKDNVAV